MTRVVWLIAAGLLVAVQQRAPLPKQFLISRARAGQFEVGEPVDDVYKAIGEHNVRLVDFYKEGLFTPGIEIRLPGAPLSPSITADIREFPCFQFAMSEIDVATLFRVRLLTAQRGGEVHGAAWSEFDLGTGWWTIPAERSKNALAHRVPLSPQAVRILKTWRQTVEESLWVFPSSRKKGPHIAHAQKAIERIVRASGVNFRGHDLRRTAASLMVGAGVPRLVVSKILNHVETGVTAVYDRHGYDPEKRAALDFWGKRLDQIVSGKRSRVLAFLARA